MIENMKMGMKKPLYQIGGPKDRDPPKLENMYYYRRLLEEALEANIRLPSPHDNINPFLFPLREPPASARARHVRRTAYDASTTPPDATLPLLTAGAAGVHTRGPQQHEDDTVRWAAGHVCYVFNKLADEHWTYVLKGLHPDFLPVSNGMTLWNQQIKKWRSKWQWEMMTAYMFEAVKSFTAVVGIMRMATLSEARRTELWSTIFDANPALISEAFRAPIKDYTNVVGVWYGSEDDLKTRHRSWLRLKFVRAAEYTWKYRVNINPEHEKFYSDCAFKLWQLLPFDIEATHLHLQDLSQVPVHRSAHRAMHASE